ncbi:MAG: tetratricopeptide repeat protein, partial [Acidimicrobiales bacterium]
MTADISTLVERGGAALADGNWSAAAEAFASVLDDEPHPGASFGLGIARWWQGEIREALRSWTAAYQGFRRAGAPVEATMAAIQLALIYNANLGNDVVASGWVRRAVRLAEEAAEPALDGWIALTESVFSTDPAHALELGQRAHAAGVANGDRDLEISALTAMGVAHVNAGNTDEGCGLLDEAMTAAVGGEVDTPDTVVFTSCLMMQACCTCADFPRVVHWVQVLDDFVAQYGNPYLHTSCRTHYGEVLAASGDWTRAESELNAAMELAADGLPKVRADAAACLAELRVTQGRVDEARRLIAGYESRPEVAAVLARLQLLDGSTTEARTTISRQLEALGGEQVASGHLRELLGECHLADGDASTAAEIGRQIVKVGADQACEIIRCRGERLLGRALAVEGEAAPARESLERALAGFAELDLPLDVARTRMALAELLVAANPELAVSEARAAHATFAELGAGPAADHAASWLRDQGVSVSRLGGPAGTA